MPWLVKTEPDAYSIDDLARDRRTRWDGVRNYQARNFMRDGMKVGDQVLVHHSSADPPAVVGLARVSAPAAPDFTALDPDGCSYDPKATKADPIWLAVEIVFVRKFPAAVPIERLRLERSLAGMALLQRGQRLSVQPVSDAELATVLGIAEEIRRLPGDAAPTTKPAKAPAKPKRTVRR
jgi:predicted RNA-binding protein with PUA-like domain